MTPASVEKKPLDRRLFGRRAGVIEAHVVLRGRDPIPCIVRNYSETGALLEVDASLAPQQLFHLVIAAEGLDILCQVRHRSAQGTGVLFVGGDCERFNEAFASTVHRAQTAEVAAPRPPKAAAVALSNRALRNAVFGKSDPEPVVRQPSDADLAADLLSTLRRTVEFSAAGFQAEPSTCNRAVIIFENGVCRGQWRSVGGLLIWSGSVARTRRAHGVDVNAAARKTLSLVLMTLVARRDMRTTASPA